MHQFFFPKKEYPAYYRPAEGGEKIKDPLSRGVDNNLDRRRHAASAAYGGRAAFPSAESSRLLRESRASRPPHGHAAWRGHGVRVSAEPIERHQKERSNVTRSGAFAAKPLKAQVTHRAINTVLLLIQHIGGHEKAPGTIWFRGLSEAADKVSSPDCISVSRESARGSGCAGADGPCGRWVRRGIPCTGPEPRGFRGSCGWAGCGRRCKALPDV